VRLLHLHGRIAPRRVVDKFYFTEIEGHPCDTLRDAVRRWKAAQIPGRLQGARPNHRVSFSFLSGRMVMRAGATIIPRNTTARIKSCTIADSCSSGLAASRAIIGHRPARGHSTNALSNASQVVGLRPCANTAVEIAEILPLFDVENRN